ncbi:UbiA-like polyprenyltransferase [Pontiella sulfatireligans]|uniref:4-hydroxybenzoate solanesyltransferase n=1 Tax=Pontiella sulfatireligans TaxID=2750658 RepID=A0A6C2UHT9_9BACT|nr:UbiA-like polyprenyltransferase [Pontiella sulfatireligans]VGO19698.1 4-hydroxybenzoate solanesyltransferase [Pontiella sulfatireligans]
MIGILFATQMEAQPFLDRGAPEGTVVAISGMGLEAARIATEKLVKEDGCTTIINAGVCGALNNRLERGAVYRVSMVSIEELKAAVNVGIGIGLKRLVSVEEPVFEPERKKELSKYGELVDMEGYAVARVCEEHSVPCIMIKGVTDFGDGNGKEDIQTHIAPVSETVAEAVFQVVDGASSSVPCATEQEAPSTLMKKLHSFTKVEHTIFSLPLLFAGAWIGAEGKCPPLATLLLIVLVGVGARTFGMAINRILDKNIDAKNPRTQNRELAAGTLSMAQGYGVALVGIVLYFLGCALLGPAVLKFSLVPLIPLSLYSLLKRFTTLCHYGIGVCMATAPIGAFVAVTNSLAFPPVLLLLALFTFCWISGFDIIYALLDIDFDRANKVRSIPAALGASKAQLVAALTHLISFAALVLLWMSVGGMLSFVALLVSAGAFGAAYLQSIPVGVRFFPISAIAGIAGALVVLLGG